MSRIAEAKKWVDEAFPGDPVSKVELFLFILDMEYEEFALELSETPESYLDIEEY